MPEHYSSIGEAIGAAMQHNIRLAHGPDTDPPLQVRYFPPPAADPYSMPGMISRLEVTASPQDVAGIVEETTSALVGPLPQLTELVAASADWARARLNFDDPNNSSPYNLWVRLASAHQMLTLAQQDLEGAIGAIAAAPAELSHPRHHDIVQVLRTRELLHDVMGAGRTETASEEKRQQAALAGSPTAAPRPVNSATAASPPTAAAPRTTGCTR
ncbi:hypothetical protein E6W39_06630 [Kitasatospora acidiphila]|uniref:Uncharacterized protein n=1 Tax=Kitasatospora acidiphila TaxID=2567942 RepID=A0A540VZ13_9ACTN|nr:hypothetical protein [Kitasatospora acidiphila]TQF02012.1 hypothetical protein E6W39_06630 [Kitasatospora acidiphila]